MLRQGNFFGSAKKRLNLIVAIVLGCLFSFSSQASELAKANQQLFLLSTTSSPQKRIAESVKYLNSLTQGELQHLIDEMGAERIWRTVNRNQQRGENKNINQEYKHDQGQKPSNKSENVKINLADISKDIRQQLSKRSQKNAYIRVINNILLNSAVKQSKKGVSNE